jgi:hypothetical protein
MRSRSPSIRLTRQPSAARQPGRLLIPSCSRQPPNCGRSATPWTPSPRQPRRSRRKPAVPEPSRTGDEQHAVAFHTATVPRGFDGPGEAESRRRASRLPPSRRSVRQLDRVASNCCAATVQLRLTLADLFLARADSPVTPPLLIRLSLAAGCRTIREARIAGKAGTQPARRRRPCVSPNPRLTGRFPSVQ